MSPRAYKSEVSVPVISSCKFLSAVGELKVVFVFLYMLCC